MFDNIIIINNNYYSDIINIQSLQKVLIVIINRYFNTLSNYIVSIYFFITT